MLRRKLSLIKLMMESLLLFGYSKCKNLIPSFPLCGCCLPNGTEPRAVETALLEQLAGIKNASLPFWCHLQYVIHAGLSCSDALNLFLDSFPSSLTLISDSIQCLLSIDIYSTMKALPLSSFLNALKMKNHGAFTYSYVMPNCSFILHSTK